MFIVCFIHSFWTCGNQNQQCNYTCCCLCGTGSGQMLWWGQQFSWKVSINFLALLDWCFSPVDKSPCKSSFPASLLFTARAGWTSHPNVSVLLRPSVKSLPQLWWGFLFPGPLHSHLSQPSPPLLLYFACLTGHLHVVPSGSTCLPIIALGIMRNIRRGLLALLYMVSSCCRYDWAEPTGKCLWSVGQKFRLSHKQLCLHCCLLWLHYHSSV